MLVAFKLLLFVLGYNCRIVVAAANFIGIACAAGMLQPPHNGRVFLLG